MPDMEPTTRSAVKLTHSLTSERGNKSDSHHGNCRVKGKRGKAKRGNFPQSNRNLEFPIKSPIDENDDDCQQRGKCAINFNSPELVG